MYLHSDDPIIAPGTRSNAARGTISRRCIAGRAAAWAKQRPPSSTEHAT
eukprot:SAG25_NODE_347_length_9358_cov_86.358315_3_plen_49_part_00